MYGCYYNKNYTQKDKQKYDIIQHKSLQRAVLKLSNCKLKINN